MYTYIRSLHILFWAGPLILPTIKCYIYLKWKLNNIFERTNNINWRRPMKHTRLLWLLVLVNIIIFSYPCDYSSYKWCIYFTHECMLIMKMCRVVGMGIHTAIHIFKNSSMSLVFPDLPFAIWDSYSAYFFKESGAATIHFAAQLYCLCLPIWGWAVKNSSPHNIDRTMNTIYINNNNSNNS